MDRKKELLDIGARMASKIGAANVTRRAVAVKAGVSDALVAHYLGSTAEAQKKYAAHAKKLGLTLPDKAKVEAIGTKLRAHGPRDKRDTRKRTPREVEAIKRKVVAKPTAKAARKAKRLPTATKAALRIEADMRSIKPAPTKNKAKPAAPQNKERSLAPLAAPGCADVAS